MTALIHGVVLLSHCESASVRHLPHSEAFKMDLGHSGLFGVQPPEPGSFVTALPQFTTEEACCIMYQR